jgi:GGDEF domain-containing protein
MWPASRCRSVIDLDLFKRYNDRFDHLTGVAFCAPSREQVGLRATDIFGRYGGGSSCQICGTPAGRCDGNAERLRSASALSISILRSVGPLTGGRGAVRAGRADHRDLRASG